MPEKVIILQEIDNETTAKIVPRPESYNVSRF